VNVKNNGKHFHPNNGCWFWLQFKLLIDLMFESVHSEQRRSLPLSLLVKLVDSLIRKRSNSTCHFHCLTGNSTIVSFNNPAFFCLRSLYYQSIFNCQRSCHVHMQGDVAHNMYPFPAVYQRISNQLIQIWHWLVDINLCCVFWWKPRDSTANGCKMTVH